MLEGEPKQEDKEQKPEILDISDRVSAIISDPEKQFKSIEIIDLCHTPEIRNAQGLSITLNYMGEDWANWAKAWKEGGTARQKREISIRVTKAQKDKSPNAFASGVKWIEVDEHGNEIKKEE